jgi:hypothetical protein
MASIAVGPNYAFWGRIPVPPAPQPVSARAPALLPAAAATLSPAQAYEQAKAAETNLDPRDYQSNPNFSDAAVSAVILSGMLPGDWSNPGGACTGQQAPNLNLFKTASGLALGTTQAGLGVLASTGVVIPGLTTDSSAAAAASASGVAISGIATAAIAGVGVIIGIVALIFAHHAAAVRQEDQIYCAALPAASNAFEVIQTGVQDGTLTPAQGSAALDALLANFEHAIAPSYGHSPFCNALCEQKIMLDAYVRYWKSQYAAMPAPSLASSLGAALGGSSGTISGSNLLMILLLILVAVVLSRRSAVTRGSS